MNGVIYARYSSENQREESIEGQLRECTAFAEKNEIHIIETYIDRAFSAKTDRRPDFQRMIKESGKKAFEIVLVWKLDRFARNRYDSATYKAKLKRTGFVWYRQQKRFRQDRKGSFWNRYWKGWRNIIPSTFPKKFYGVIPKTHCIVSATGEHSRSGL